MQDLRYPIGQFQASPLVTIDDRREFLRQMAEAPERLNAAVEALSPDQMGTPYRPGGWTVRQVVHHLADSHMNWYCRTKLVLTESDPVIKPYDEKLWSELSDARSGPIRPSLLLLEGMHERWVQILGSLGSSDWARKMVHPERGELTLDDVLQMTAWHGRHHTAHITELRRRMGW